MKLNSQSVAASISKLLFFLITVSILFTNCGHFRGETDENGVYHEGPSVYSGGAWVLLVIAALLILNGIRIFYRTSHKGSEITQGNPGSGDYPSLPWYSTGWGWINTIIGVGGGLLVIIVQNWNK